MLHARRGDQFIEGDDGAGADLVDGAAHAELLQHALQHLGVLLQRLLVHRADALAGLGQDAERGQVEALAGFEIEGLLVGVVARLGRLDRRHAGLDRFRRAGGGGRNRRGGGCVFPRRGVGGGLVVGRIGVVVALDVGGRRRHGRRLGLFVDAARTARRRGCGGGRGFGHRAGGFAGTLGPLGAAGGVLLGGPAGGVGEVTQAQADRIAESPQAEDQEQAAGDPASARNVQGGQALR
ncbi:hypothetical protein D3C85_732440 [compost metagenome]